MGNKNGYSRLNFVKSGFVAVGFVCPHCGHTKYCKSKRKHDHQCTCCRRAISLTNQTLFHKLKFPILKALYIVYYVSTYKKVISSTELSRKLYLRQKTCWSFKQKVMRAVASSANNKIGGKAKVDETVVGGQEEGVKGHKNDKKKLVVFAIEKKGKGISRIHGKVIKQSSLKEPAGIMRSTIEITAEIKTDKWSGYSPLSKDLSNVMMSGMDIPVMRLDEVYLILAEVLAEQGKDEAQVWVNKVRTRSSVNAAPKTVADGNLVYIVRHERWVELACESLRIFDLIRWGTLEETFGDGKKVKRHFFSDYLSESSSNKYDSPIGNLSADPLFPTPQLELDRNPNINTQIGDWQQ